MISSASPPDRSPDGADAAPVSRAVLFADLLDPTSLAQRFGDAHATVVLRRFDLQVGELLELTHGRLIDKTEGLLALFERPLQAVDFALRYQQSLRQFGAGEGIAPTARIGIDVGQVMTWSNSEVAVAAGAKPLEVEGLARPVAVQLRSLALPGQILISSAAESEAQRDRFGLGERAGRVRWARHGRYRFQGLAVPLPVHEVGEADFAPMRAPPSGLHARLEPALWRRPKAIAVGLLLLMAIAGFAVYDALRGPPPLTFQERDWVVVGDVSNLTGDARLEESLDTALRIDLEQSRFVNVLSGLKVEDVLQRMGRSPRDRVDRAVGSEIALREGARALLLPSVVETGGRLRVSVEVVDPNTRLTVFAESAEGRGAQSALASLDTVNRRMREKLGEAVADIRSTGKPLPEVTTGNLDALRAYALAERRSGEARFDEAAALNEEAIRLDPDFAMAHLALARLRLSYGDDIGYYAELAKAESLRSRLSYRERLQLDGRMAMHAPVARSLSAWRLLTELYPDEFSGYYNYGLSSWYHGYKRPDAQDFLRPALDARNPRRRSAYYLQGVLQLTQERYAEAVASFQQYESLGGQGYNQQHAQALAAQRRFDEAQALLRKHKPSNVPNLDFPSRVDTAVFSLDQGQWRAGMSVMDQLLPAASKINAETARRTQLMQISLRAFAPDPKLADDIRSFVAGTGDGLRRPSLVARLNEAYHLLSAGLIATQNGDAATGRRALELASAQALAAGYPSLDNATAMLQAALSIHDDQPARAIARLQPLHDGNELYLSHAVLMRAFEAAKRFGDAAAEADWLVARRGLAYGEFNVDLVMNPANVVQSNLALLSSAEYRLAADDPERARLRLAQFSEAWPNANELDFLRDRLARLESGLAAQRRDSRQASVPIPAANRWVIP